MSVIRISEFDTWRPGYGLATVRVLKANTSNLADIFEDEDMSIPGVNPQTLLERTVEGISYGKFSQSLYVGQPYQLEINSVDGTGIVRPPLDTLDGQDASAALVEVTGGATSSTLADMFARTIDVRDYGEFKEVGSLGASAATNNATLISAIGVAGSAGGGYVEVPEGTYAYTAMTLPQGVVMRGRGRGATILQSVIAEASIALDGEKAGLSSITIDGVSQVGGSVGISSVGKNDLVFENCEIKRFETGIYFKGGAYQHWNQLFISDCETGAKFHGDVDSGNGSEGNLLEFIDWRGGKVELCSVAGLDLRYIDRACSNLTFTEVAFDTNTGIAVKALGAQAVRLLGCKWIDNTINLDIADNEIVSPTVRVIDFLIEDATIESGDIDLAGTLENVVFRRTVISGVDITLTTPTHNVLAEDCRETAVTLAGVSTAWLRSKTTEAGASSGLTTGNALTKAWAITLEPGQCVYLEAKVVGRQRNGTNRGFYHMGVSAFRPGASLAYDSQTGNFTLGNIVTGATSGATGRIIADTDGGATGTLSLQDIDGIFLDNEIVTDGSGGSATANGTQSYSNALLRGPAAQVPYDAQSANFTAGATLTGATSGATGLIVGDTDGGTTGTLFLVNLTGTFVNDEAIADSLGGAATVNGLQTGGAATNIRSPVRPASLAYDGQTANFVAGALVVGATSGATGTILTDTDGGATGTLLLQNASGIFADNETIRGSNGGIAVMNGFMQEVWKNALFVANGPEIELRVGGDTSQTVEWSVAVEVVSS